MPEALICGAGKIGRGFIAHLLSRSGWDMYFLDVAPDLVAALHQAGTYTVYLAGTERADDITFQAALTPDQDQELQDIIERVELITISVGARHLEATADMLRGFLQKRQNQQPVNCLICENAQKPAEQIERVLKAGQPEEWQQRVDAEIGLIETQVLRSGMSVDPLIAEREPLSLKMQDWWTLPADADAVKGSIPSIEGLELKNNFGNELQRKLYTFNGLNGPIAYLGYAAGHTYMHEAANDVRLQPVLDRIQHESSHGLIHEFGFDEQEQAAFAGLARRKYADPSLADQIERNARDSARKLAAHERLLGPALLAWKHDLEADACAWAIAAALRYDGSDDPGTQAVQDLLQKRGPAVVLRNYAGLTDDHPLLHAVLAAYHHLQTPDFDRMLLSCT